jgi:prevent-host-death family protein
MARYNIAQAKAHFSELVRKALAGEEVVLSRDNKPLLKVIPLGATNGTRRPGSAKGRVRIAADFDGTPDDFADYS